MTKYLKIGIIFSIKNHKNDPFFILYLKKKFFLLNSVIDSVFSIIAMLFNKMDEVLNEIELTNNWSGMTYKKESCNNSEMNFN